MQVVKNEHSGNTMITVDEADLALLKKAVWDEQLFLVQTMRQHPDHRERLWQDMRERWIPLAEALGAGVPFGAYDKIIRKGIEVRG